MNAFVPGLVFWRAFVVGKQVLSWETNTAIWFLLRLGCHRVTLKQIL
jgi:hypothetical protein